jgi:L-iditol 2-dehydrogenase
MKCVVLRQEAGGHKPVVVDVEAPMLKKGDMLVEMKVCGLCGTDIEKIHGQYTAAQPVIGHEAVGIVREVDDDVEGFRVGDRVFPHHHVPCHECHFCRAGSETMCEMYRKSNLDPGGFSELIRVPEWNLRKGGVLKIPEGVSFEEASFIEPAACCIRALNRCRASRGETALVVGAGPVGLTHVQLLALRGVEVFVSDVIPTRLSYARKTRGAEVLDARSDVVHERIREATGGRGADVAIVASGSIRAVTQALKSVRKGGRVCLFGVPARGSKLEYDVSDIFNSEISIISSYAATDAETAAALQLMVDGDLKLSPLITHRFHLDEFSSAVQAAVTGEAMKVIVTP